MAMKFVQNGGGKFLDTFWELADEDSSVRIEGVRRLAEFLEDGNNEMVAYSVRRLCSGLESSRGGARRGFGAALSCCLETKVLSLQAVIAEVVRRAAPLGWGPKAELTTDAPKGKKKSTQHRSEERSVELGVMLTMLCLARSGLVLTESEAEPLVMVCVAAIEKRQWLKELGTRCLALLLEKDTSNRRQLFHLVENSQAFGPLQSQDLASEPEQLAMRILFNEKLPSKKHIFDTCQPALSKAARSFPAIHCAWEFLLRRAGLWPGFETFKRRDVWSIIDHEATHGSLERRGMVLLLAERVSCDTDKAQLASLALSPSICTLIVGATKTNSKSHIKPLAQRLLKRIVSSAKHKTSDWRLAVASALMTHGDSRFDTRTNTHTVKSLLSGESLRDHADFLVHQALALNQTDRANVSAALDSLRGLILSVKPDKKSDEDSAGKEVRLLLLALCARIAFYHETSFTDFEHGDDGKAASAVKAVLEKNAQAIQVDEHEKAAAVRIFWSVIADNTSAALEEACALEACFARLVHKKEETVTMSSQTQRLAKLAREYLGLDEEAESILDQELNSNDHSVDATARSACTLLALSHETPAARATRFTTVRALADQLHTEALTPSALDYLFGIAAGDKDEFEDDDDEEEDDDSADDMDEDSSADKVENDSKDEDQDEDKSFGDDGADAIETHGDEDAEEERDDDDIMLTAEELGELLASESGGAEAHLLAAKQAHRKAGAVRGVKIEMQLQLRVLDLVEKAVCARTFADSAECTVSAIRGAIALAVRGKEIEAWQDEVPETRDWLKRVAQLVKQRLGRHAAKWGGESIQVRTEAARGLRLVLGNTLGWQRNSSQLFSELLVQIAALCARCFFHELESSVDPDQDACTTYKAVIPRCLGVKRAGLRIQVLQDCILRAPRLAVDALLSGLVDAVTKAPSAFLQLEAVVLTRECVLAAKQHSLQLEASAVNSLATALVKQLQNTEKSERVRKLLDCALVLLETTAVPSATEIKRTVDTLVQEKFQTNGAIKHLATRIAKATPSVTKKNKRSPAAESDESSAPQKKAKKAPVEQGPATTTTKKKNKTEKTRSADAEEEGGNQQRKQKKKRKIK